jgi:predicted DNA-binding transcriptional regulator AlpA
MNDRLNAAVAQQQEYVTLPHVLIMTSLSRSGMTKKERAGQFVPRFKINRRRYYRAQDVRAWMESHLVTAQ